MDERLVIHILRIIANTIEDAIAEETDAPRATVLEYTMLRNAPSMFASHVPGHYNVVHGEDVVVITRSVKNPNGEGWAYVEVERCGRRVEGWIPQERLALRE